MGPEALDSRTEGSQPQLSNKSSNIHNNSIIKSIYTDIRTRIDSFLEHEVTNSEVRKGTQAKVIQSLGIIQKALADYGYVLLKQN